MAHDKRSGVEGHCCIRQNKNEPCDDCIARCRTVSTDPKAKDDQFIIRNIVKYNPYYGWPELYRRANLYITARHSANRSRCPWKEADRLTG